MPDSSGKIRGIAVPSVPWHETDDEPRWLSTQDLQYQGGGVMARKRRPAGDLTPVETGVRDADQMLWDKQTDEGPSALEKLRDK